MGRNRIRKGFNNSREVSEYYRFSLSCFAIHGQSKTPSARKRGRDARLPLLAPNEQGFTLLALSVPPALKPAANMDSITTAQRLATEKFDFRLLGA